VRWKTASGRQAAGSVAGNLKLAGHYIGVGSKRYKTSRIIFKMVYDQEPPEVDHIDLDNSNNALKNLRAATQRQNALNKRVRKDNVLGVKGVHRVGKAFIMQIVVDGVKIRERFVTVEDAKAAYAAASAKFHGEFGRAD
jgi:ABC-type uncharacterized transport system ATPase subunit